MPSTPPSSLNDPHVQAFVAIPLTLAVLFVVGVWHAWRRSGASRAHATRAAFLATAGTAAWMAATDTVARAALLRQWDADGPFMLVAAHSQDAHDRVVTDLGSRRQRQACGSYVRASESYCANGSKMSPLRKAGDER